MCCGGDLSAWTYVLARFCGIGVSKHMRPPIPRRSNLGPPRFLFNVPDNGTYRNGVPTAANSTAEASPPSTTAKSAAPSARKVFLDYLHWLYCLCHCSCRYLFQEPVVLSLYFCRRSSISACAGLESPRAEEKERKKRHALPIVVRK
jgi:hypothetical protein